MHAISQCTEVPSAALKCRTSAGSMNCYSKHSRVQLKLCTVIVFFVFKNISRLYESKVLNVSETALQATRMKVYTRGIQLGIRRYCRCSAKLLSNF